MLASRSRIGETTRAARAAGTLANTFAFATMHAAIRKQTGTYSPVLHTFLTKRHWIFSLTDYSIRLDTGTRIERIRANTTKESRRIGIVVQSLSCALFFSPY
jgi:hypothetical protein